MPTQEAIRRLVIEGQSRGMDKLASDLKKVADGQRDVRSASDGTAVATERATTSIESARRVFENLQRRIDPVHRELRQVEKDFRDLNRAIDQGTISAEQYAQTSQKIIQRTTSFREATAGRDMMRDANPAFSHIAAFREQQRITEEIRAQREMMRDANPADAHIRAFKEEQRITQEMRAQREIMRDANPADAHVEAYRAAQRTTQELRAQRDMIRDANPQTSHIDLYNQQRIQRDMMRDANPQDAHVEAFRQQQAAAKASAAAEKDLAKQTNELLQQIDPIGEATKRYNSQLMQNAVLAGHGRLTADQLAAANKRAADNLQLVQKGSGVAAQGFTNLGYQINDVISGLAMGQPILTIAAQQGGQIAQALNGPAGIAGGLKAVGARAVEMITPMRVLGVTLVGAAVEGAFAWNRLVDQQTKVHVALRTTTMYLGQTKEAFMAMAEEAGKRGGLSGRQGVNAGLDIAAGGRFDPETLRAMIERTKDFSATIGEDAADAAGKFGQAMGSLNGILALNASRIRFLDGAEISHIRNLEAQGKMAEMSAFAFDKLQKLLIPATEGTGKAASAWAILKNAVDDLDRSLGKYIQTFLRYTAVGASDLATGIGRGQISGKARNPGEALGEVVGAAAEGVRKISGGSQERGQSGTISPRGNVAVAITESEQAAADAAMIKYQDTIEKTKNSVAELTAEEMKNSDARRYWTTQFEEMSRQYGVSAEQQKKYENAAKFVRDMRAKDVEAFGKEMEADFSRREAVDKLITASESYRDVRGREMSDNDVIIRQAEIEEQLKGRVGTAEKLALETEKDRLAQRGVLQTQQAFDINIQKGANALIKERTTSIEDDMHAEERRSQAMLKTGDAREIDLQLAQRQIQFRQQNMPLNAAEEAHYVRMLELVQKRSNVGQQLQRLYSESVQPAKDLINTIEAANILFKNGEMNATQYANAILDIKIKAAQAEQTLGGGFTAGLLRVQREMGDLSKQIEGFTYNSFNNMTTALLDIMDGTKSAADGFKDFGKTAIRALNEMIIKTQIMAPLVKGLFGGMGGGGGLLGSLFGGGGGGSAGVAAAGNPVFGTMHSGGVVGKDVSEWRNIHPAYFDRAPRLHSGTLGADERPTILQTGEVVLSRKDVSAARGGAAGGGNVAMNINVVGARGNREIEEMVASGVQMGIAGYDKGLQKGGLARRMAGAQSRGQIRR